MVGAQYFAPAQSITKNVMGSSIDIIHNIYIAYRVHTAVCIRSSSSNNDFRQLYCRNLHLMGRAQNIAPLPPIELWTQSI